MKVSWRDGLRAKVDAQAAHGEFERLRAIGPLTATAVFEAARPAKAVLHGEFEWDGAEAVRQLGLIRARTLLRGIVVYDEAQPAEAPRHLFVHAPSADAAQAEGQYIRLTDLAQQPDEYIRAIGELSRKFASASQALDEVRRLAHGREEPEKLAALEMVAEGFVTLRAALQVLGTAA